jgi:fatty acid desaturase
MCKGPAPENVVQLTDLWSIDGKAYDLTPFLDRHPGGRRVLELARGERDCTPSLESYHALADLDSIRKMLAKYEVKKVDVPPPLYTFADGGFYASVRAKVRQHFKDEAPTSAGSMTKRIKATKAWAAVVALQASVYACAAYVAFFSEYSISFRASSAVLAGAFYIGLGFKVMHDGSHFALAARNVKANLIPAELWIAGMWWQLDLWTLHHSVRHHAYTGHPQLDPDLRHARPFVNKDARNVRGYWRVSPALVPAWAAAVVFFFPGQAVGQALSYMVLWRLKKRLWGMKLPEDGVKWPWHEMCAFFLAGFVHLYGGSLIVSAAYILSLNVFYAVFILPDHDQIGTASNHVDGEGDDWGVVQVRNSGNFAVGGRELVCHFFGGINYQIEHHLFPSVNHVHLPRISKIVREVCQEHGVPYVVEPSVWSAFASSLSHYKAVQTKLFQKNSTKP